MNICKLFLLDYPTELLEAPTSLAALHWLEFTRTRCIDRYCTCNILILAAMSITHTDRHEQMLCKFSRSISTTSRFDAVCLTSFPRVIALSAWRRAVCGSGKLQPHYLHETQPQHSNLSLESQDRFAYERRVPFYVPLARQKFSTCLLTWPQNPSK